MQYPTPLDSVPLSLSAPRQQRGEGAAPDLHQTDAPGPSRCRLLVAVPPGATAAAADDATTPSATTNTAATAATATAVPFIFISIPRTTAATTATSAAATAATAVCRRVAELLQRVDAAGRTARCVTPAGAVGAGAARTHTPEAGALLRGRDASSSSFKSALSSSCPCSLNLPLPLRLLRLQRTPWRWCWITAPPPHQSTHPARPHTLLSLSGF